MTTSVLHDLNFVTVNVHTRDAAFGCKVNTSTPVAELVLQLRDLFLDRSGGSGALHDYLSAEQVEWALEHGPIRERIAPENTLEDAGVLPGAELYLTQRTRTESFPVLRDDVAEGAAEVSKRVFSVVEPADTRRLGALAFPGAALMAAAVGIATVLGGDTSLRWAAVAVLAALAAMSASVAGVLARSRTGYADVVTALSVSAYVAAAAAAFLGVPRDPGVWQLATVGSATAAMTVLLWAVTGNRPPGLHSAMATASSILVVAGTAVLLLRGPLPMGPQAVSALLVFAAVAVMVWSTQIARRIGGVRVNYLPTIGEPLALDADTSVTEVSKRATSAEAIEAMLNQEHRVVTALHAMIGMVTAAAALLPPAAFAAGFWTRTYEWQTFALIACAAVAAFALGRSLVIRSAAVPMMLSGPLTAAAYLTGRVLSDTPPQTVVLAAGFAPLLMAVLLSAIWAVQSHGLHSPLAKRRLEIVATAAVAGMFPLLVLILEGWAKVRGR